jgi:3-oxoadipate enol-lactonase
MGYLNIGDIRMHYKIQGQGEPLLLIMGLGGHILDWGWDLPKELSKHYQVVMFDNRGAGLTTQPPGPYSIKQLAEDAVGLMDAIGLKRSIVFGASMGGMVAQEIAMNHPLRVTKLVLGGTSVGGKERIKPAREIEAYMQPRLDLTPQGYLWWCAPAVYTHEFIYKHPEIVERKIQANLTYPSKLHAYEAQLAALRAYDSYCRLPSINAKTMVLTGNRDVLFPPENSRILARLIPDAQLEEIDGAGHLFWISHPKETLHALTSFLG